MSSKRLAYSTHRLALNAAQRQATPRVMFKPDTSSAAPASTAFDSLKLSLTCTPPCKLSFLEDLNKPTATEGFARDMDAALEDAKKIVPESGKKPVVPSNFTIPAPGLSIKSTNSLPSQEEQPTSRNEESRKYDEDDADFYKDNNVDDKMGYKYALRHLEDDLDCMQHYNPYRGYTARQVLEDCNRSITKFFPHLNKAINEWYDIVGVPKVYLNSSNEALGTVLEYRVPGGLAQSLARHVGICFLDWRSDEKEL
ncbi:hypothetical protein BJ741DRAFT_654171 [Chytriomyces cf. hyalinus JEL632]|nr:hypothetical protein BJ741DRAFT_654171 [Chytriomyces cf. hyalinus JEL632]